MRAKDAFAVICVPKSLSLDKQDEGTADKARILQDELEFQVAAHPEAKYTMLKCSGGGVVTMGDVQTANTGKGLAAFQGKLKNLEELTARFPPNWCSETTISAAQTAATAADHAANGAPPKDPHNINAAELVLWMYLQMGPKALSFLHGRFVVCLYDVQQMRVLAARDGTGVIPLFEAHTAKNSLIISSSADFLEGASDRNTFEPGYFKYGWHAPPRPYNPAEFASHFAVDPRRHSFDAHQGLNRRSVDSHAHRHSHDAAQGAGRRNSVSDHTPRRSSPIPCARPRSGSSPRSNSPRSADQGGMPHGSPPNSHFRSRLSKPGTPGTPPLPPHRMGSAAAASAAAAAACSPPGMQKGGGNKQQGVTAQGPARPPCTSQAAQQAQQALARFKLEEHVNAKPFVPQGR